MDIMLDLETLGTDPYSPVIAIGAVRFDARNPLTIHKLQDADIFYQVITLESCMAAGLKPSASTIQWWMTEKTLTPAARAIFADLAALALPLALDAFTDWLNSAPDTLWGNSAEFDCGLLRGCYKALGKEVPWLFYKQGCYRTIKNLQAAKGIELIRVGTHHNAVDDALSQAEHLCRIFQALKL